MHDPRYSRQMILPEIGQSGQDALARAKILVIGAGGLGCPALIYLAGAGVGHIGIADHDTVEKSNLHRQVLYTPEDIGINKAVAAQRNLEAYNPAISITAISERIEGGQAQSVINDYDVIIDGTDNFASKFLINDMCVKLEKPFITASVLRFAGQVSVFSNQGSSACYRCLYPAVTHPPLNCAQAGVLGSVAGMLGTVQATEAVKFLCGLSTLSNQVWSIDALSMRATVLDIPKNPHCRVCTLPKSEIEIDTMTQSIDMSTDAVRALKNPYLLDVREQDEWDAGFIDGAHHHALSRITDGDMPHIPVTGDVIIYCRSGQRSLYVTQILRDQGHENVFNMTGGILAWGA